MRNLRIVVVNTIIDHADDETDTDLQEQAERGKALRIGLLEAGYNIIAIPLAAGVLEPLGFVLSPAVGAVLMSASTVIVAINAQLLRRVSLG